MPGPTQFARTPKRPSSTASARTSASMVPLGPTDNASRAGWRRAPALVTATMLPPRGPQVRERGVHDVVERHHLLLEVLAERRRFHPAHVQLAHERPRRVHERVHAPELPGRVVDGRRGGRGIEQVDPTGDGPPTVRCHVARNGTRRVFVAAVEDGDVAPPFAEHPAHCGAQAAAATRDHGHARQSVEVSRHRPRRLGHAGRGGRRDQERSRAAGRRARRGSTRAPPHDGRCATRRRAA